MKTPSALISAINRKSARNASPAIGALVEAILARHGAAAQAVLFYGSCLRTGDDRDGLVDLYLLVDGYRAAYASRMQAFLNKLLPPNVYYLERVIDGGIVRTKYAVISLADFEKGTSMRWFHSYLWGRFCQPAALLFARDERISARINGALARAVLTFTTRVLPRVTTDFSARQLWRTGLALSYRAELRAEHPGRGSDLFDADREYYEDVTRIALGAVDYPVEVIESGREVFYRSRISGPARALSRLAWGLRTAQGKLLSVLRLLKAVTTFEGGVDYILWKIERHSGVKVEVEPHLRRHPLLAMGVLSWRLYKRGGFR